MIRRPVTHPTISSTPAAEADRISLRVAVYALVAPVLLSLVLMVLRPERYGGAGTVRFSNSRLGSTLAVELLIVATVGLWLWHRGWRPHRTATRPFVGRDVLRGLGVWVLALLAAQVSVNLWHLAAPAATAGALRTQIFGQPSFALIIPVSVVNAVFEEFLWLGLGVAALQRFGSGLAAAVSIALRTLVHAYQGPLAVLAILPIGVVFTLYYVRTRRLWPVVIAHGLQDFLALAALALRAYVRGAV
jgi:membrane protease YdiL (CAAX protease family)